MAIFPELIEMLLGAIFVIAQIVHAETDQGADSNKEQKIPPHNDTSNGKGCASHDGGWHNNRSQDEYRFADLLVYTIGLTTRQSN